MSFVFDRGGDHRRGDRDRRGAERSPETGYSLRAGIPPLSSDDDRLDSEPSFRRVLQGSTKLAS